MKIAICSYQIVALNLFAHLIKGESLFGSAIVINDLVKYRFYHGATVDHKYLQCLSHEDWCQNKVSDDFFKELKILERVSDVINNRHVTLLKSCVRWTKKLLEVWTQDVHSIGVPLRRLRKSVLRHGAPRPN